MTSRKRCRSRVKNFPMYIKFDYNIKAASEDEAKEIMLRLFLAEIHNIAANVDTVEDFVLHRSKITFSSVKGESRGESGFVE